MFVLRALLFGLWFESFGLGFRICDFGFAISAVCFRASAPSSVFPPSITQPLIHSSSQPFIHRTNSGVLGDHALPRRPPPSIPPLRNPKSQIRNPQTPKRKRGAPAERLHKTSAQKPTRARARQSSQRPRPPCRRSRRPRPGGVSSGRGCASWFRAPPGGGHRPGYAAL